MILNSCAGIITPMKFSTSAVQTSYDSPLGLIILAASIFITILSLSDQQKFELLTKRPMVYVHQEILGR